MKIMKKSIMFLFVCTLSLVSTGSMSHSTQQQYYEAVVIEELELNKENFFLVCEIYEVQFPEIVYAQARLESANFKSKLFETKNNFLGLYNSKVKDFYEFGHWTECIRGYKDLLQFKYTGDEQIENYYQFLIDLPYAMDPQYITKVKKIAGHS